MSDADDGEFEDWRLIWRTDRAREDRDEYLSTVLPRYATDKHNRVPCTIDHLAKVDPSDADIDLQLTTHYMGSILTLCRSERCRTTADGEDCWCRYKINTCEDGNTTIVFQQGAHVMDDLSALSPLRARITPAMKVVLEDQLERHPSLTPLQLLSTLSYKIANTELRGPEPSYNQVEYFLRVWRDNHPGADTHQVSSAIDPSLYDEVGIHERSPRAVVYFSEAVRDQGRWVSRVGVGTEDDPYRIGLICYQLLYVYVQVQTNPDVAFIVHIDSTFNTVKQKYPAFVIGYSDRCGQFFPLGYFCTSKRKNADVGWCLRHLQRAILDTFHVHFQPEFVMTDADKAQYKASRNELPSSRVLMCWYHVTANVYNLEETDKFFEDLYDLHYVPEDEFADLKTEILARWAALPAGSAAFKMGCYVKKVVDLWEVLRLAGFPDSKRLSCNKQPA